MAKKLPCRWLAADILYPASTALILLARLAFLGFTAPAANALPIKNSGSDVGVKSSAVFPQELLAEEKLRENRAPSLHNIDRPEKIGLGIWDKDNRGSALRDIERAQFAWYYNWSERALGNSETAPDAGQHTPMLWDKQKVTRHALAVAKHSGSDTLLGFNEPDDLRQANMSVEEAISLWGQLQTSGLRLGSPAATQHGVLGSQSWLGRFMAEADRLGLRVDFIAVHYYSKDQDVGAFKAWLEAVHQQYGKPIWVTEWALADWENPNRFSAAEQAAFARAGAEMMDDLAYVERHAWFAAYEGGDGWHLNSGVFDQSGKLTEVGEVSAELNDRGRSYASFGRRRIAAEPEVTSGIAKGYKQADRGSDSIP